MIGLEASKTQINITLLAAINGLCSYFLLLNTIYRYADWASLQASAVRLPQWWKTPAFERAPISCFDSDCRNSSWYSILYMYVYLHVHTFNSWTKDWNDIFTHLHIIRYRYTKCKSSAVIAALIQVIGHGTIVLTCE